MESADVQFDLDLELRFRIEQEPESVTLVLSDALDASEEDLEPLYLQRVADFIDASATWYPRCVERIRAEAPQAKEIQLVRAYVLSEQDDYPLVVGLSFWVDFDLEHGRGLKLDAMDFSILDYGAADIAFTRGLRH